MPRSHRLPAVVGALVVGIGLTWIADPSLSGYGGLALIGWLVLVLSFMLAHEPERTMTEIIRDAR